MTAADKDTIYIDIDDEITSIIDKVRASDGKIVALVLPKRASVLQSIVNMKLLKRAADDAKKHLVLVTTEAGLLPLAGATGMMVAKTLTSKPAVPTPPQLDDDREETVNEDSETPDFSKEAVAGAAVGALAGLPPEDDVETLELDDDTPDPAEEDAEAAAPVAVAATAPKVKKDKKLRVPNFERFRAGLVLAILAVPALILLLIWAFAWAPKATIGINTNAVNVNADFNFVMDTGAKSVDTSTNTVPAKLVQQQKTYTQQATATGQKNQGDKATGSVVMSSQSCAPNLNGPPDDVSAGAGISSGGLTFITQEDASFTHSKAKGSCITYSTDAVAVKAQGGGSNYNLNNATFSVGGGVTATGSTSGGTDDIVKVVSQNDIDSAKNKVNTNDPTVKQTLSNQLQQGGYFAVTATFNAGTPTVTTSANVGDTTDTVTVTEVVSYTMFGAREKDLDKLVDNNVASQIDTTKQSILSEGLSSASFNVSSQDTKTAQIALQAVATAGPDLDVNAIKKQAAGQKVGDVKQAIQNDPGVTGVNVKLSPFWVSSVPKKTSKITVTISKPTAPAKSSNGN